MLAPTTRAARLWPGRPAVAAGDRVMTYCELESAVLGMLVALERAGISRRAPVGLLGENSIAWIAAYLALSRLGATVMLLNTRLADAELQQQLGASGARDVLADEGQANRDLGPVRPHALEEAPPASGARADRPLRTRQAHTLVFTSGSTERPRGVILTWPQQLASARASVARFALDETDVWLACLPMCHVGGLAILHRMAECGGCVALLPRFEARAVAAAGAHRAVTRISLTPTMLAQLSVVGWQIPEQVRTVLLGGEHVPAALLERCPAAVASYGMTETGSHVCVGESGQTAMSPLAGFQVRVLGPSGQSLRAGEAGRVAIRGPAVMRGYLGGPALAGAWFVTDDLGALDSSGRLTVLARPADLILSGGENVSPAEVEAILHRHPGVAAAAVAGVPHPRWGEVPAALIVPRTGAKVPEDLEAFARRYLAGYKVPRTYRMAARLPELPSGKIDRRAVAELLAGSVAPLTAEATG